MFEAASVIIAAVLKTGVPLYVAALIATSLLLFLPGSVAHQIGVDEFRQSFRGYLGSAFVLSISLLAAAGISAASGFIRNHLDNRRLRRLTLEALRTLTDDEKQFLRPFIANGRNTVHSAITDGVAGGLVAKSLIYRSSNIIQNFAAPFNLQPIARKLLAENPKLLD